MTDIINILNFLELTTSCLFRLTLIQVLFVSYTFHHRQSEFKKYYPVLYYYRN